MGKEKHKCTLRLSTDEIEQIEAYPGKNFTEKARSLFAAHAVEMDELPGEDLKEQYEILQGMKVRLVQGYYFDRPMPKKDFESKYV